MKFLSHLSVSIAGLEQIIYDKQSQKKGLWQVFTDDNGEPLTLLQTIKLIEETKKKGYKVITCCDNLDGEGRCKGHPIEEKGATP